MSCPWPVRPDDPPGPWTRCWNAKRSCKPITPLGDERWPWVKTGVKSHAWNSKTKYYTYIIHKCIHKYLYMYLVYIYIYIYAYIHECIHKCLYMYIYMIVYTYIHRVLYSNYIAALASRIWALQDDLWARHVRASKMMVYKARQGPRWPQLNL